MHVNYACKYHTKSIDLYRNRNNKCSVIAYHSVKWHLHHHSPSENSKSLLPVKVEKKGNKTKTDWGSKAILLGYSRGSPACNSIYIICQSPMVISFLAMLLAVTTAQITDVPVSFAYATDSSQCFVLFFCFKVYCSVLKKTATANQTGFFFFTRACFHLCKGIKLCQLLNILGIIYFHVTSCAQDCSLISLFSSKIFICMPNRKSQYLNPLHSRLHFLWASQIQLE